MTHGIPWNPMERHGSVGSFAGGLPDFRGGKSLGPPGRVGPKAPGRQTASTACGGWTSGQLPLDGEKDDPRIPGIFLETLDEIIWM